jgi:hypothetical protein
MGSPSGRDYLQRGSLKPPKGDQCLLEMRKSTARGTAPLRARRSGATRLGASEFLLESLRPIVDLLK